MHELGVAFIGAAGAMGAASLPLAKSWLDRSRDYPTINEAVRTALQGVWTGTGTDTHVEDGTEPVTFDLRLELEFAPLSKAIRGSVKVGVAGQPKYSSELRLMGGTFSYPDNCVQIHYRASQFARRQLGVMLFRLDDVGELRGFYAGFSPTRRCFVSGVMAARRV